MNVLKTVYPVSDFLDWQRSGQLNLRPYYQRGNVWSPKAKSSLLDTLLRGYPIPPIYLQVRRDANTLRTIRQVVDGQQRLRTLLSYIDITCLKDPEDRDRFTIMRTHNKELAGRSFDRLPQELQHQLVATELSVHVLPADLTDPSLLEVFGRLNSTGSKLNAQELRNAEFHGEFKTIAYSLAYGQLDRWREWGVFTPQAVAQMQEVEFMSDLIMALVRGPGAKTKSALDKFYEDNDDAFPEADAVLDIVPRIFDELGELLAPVGPDNQLAPLYTQSWLYTLFSLIASSRHAAPLRESTEAFVKLPRQTTRANLRKGVIAAARALGSGDIDRKLAEALRGASTDRSSRDSRLTFLLQHIKA